MSKILILSNDTTYTYNLRNEVIESLVQSGYEVVVASKFLLLQEELKALGCRLIDVPTDRHGKNPLSDLSLLRKFRKIVRTEKPDVVLTYNIKPNSYGGMACRMEKVPYMPNITGLGTAMAFPGPLQKLATRLCKHGVAGAKCIFFQNESNKQFFIHRRMMPKKAKIRVLPGSGVSLKIHRETSYPGEDEGIHFLFVARILKEKGIEIYLTAAERIRNEYPNTVFHVCGLCDDENYRQRLHEAEEKGIVKYHGEQKEMLPFFEKAHCVVHPSYYPEGMSNVLLEAAAHCRPIICTDQAGCRETVDDGKSGYLIPLKDEEALVESLVKFLNLSWEDKRDMGLCGRKKIEEQFDRKIVARIYLEEIERVLSEQNGEQIPKAGERIVHGKLS